MKKLIVLLFSILMVTWFSIVVSAETLPVKDITYYSSYGVYVLLENGTLLFGDSIDTATPQVVSTDVKKVISSSYKDFILLHSDGKIDKLNFFKYEGNKTKILNTVEYTLDVNAIDIINSNNNNSNFLYIDNFNNLYSYSEYTETSTLLYENVKKCEYIGHSKAYILTTDNSLYYMDYNYPSKLKIELALTGVSDFFITEKGCSALKKSGNTYYEYIIDVNSSGNLQTPERINKYDTLEDFIEINGPETNAHYQPRNITGKFYIENKNFYFTSDHTLYKATGQTTYGKYLENVKAVYIYDGPNFDNVYLFLTQSGELFASIGKVNRVHGTDTLDAPYLTSFCEKRTKVIINDKEVELETRIQIVNNRSMYPFRECLENMGALVMWDSTNRIAIGELNGITVEFPIDKNYYYINGEIHYMDTTSYISNGRTYIPIRFAAEALGFTVEWESTSVENKISIFE